MAKKVTAAGLEEAVKGILESYGNDVKNNLDAITKDVTRKGVQAIRAESATTFGTTNTRKEKYAKTWTSQFESNKFYSTGIIYNKQAGLPHLLENGHVLRNGTGRSFGRVEGREHIAKVERELQRLYVEEVLSKL